MIKRISKYYTIGLLSFLGGYLIFTYFFYIFRSYEFALVFQFIIVISLKFYLYKKTVFKQLKLINFIGLSIILLILNYFYLYLIDILNLNIIIFQFLYILIISIFGYYLINIINKAGH